MMSQGSQSKGLPSWAMLPIASGCGLLIAGLIITAGQDLSKRQIGQHILNGTVVGFVLYLFFGRSDDSSPSVPELEFPAPVSVPAPVSTTVQTSAVSVPVTGNGSVFDLPNNHEGDDDSSNDLWEDGLGFRL